MLEILFDIHQYKCLRDLQTSTERNHSKQTRSEDRIGELLERVAELERRLEKQTLVSMALWELLKGELSDEALIDEVRRIDLLDGKLDGRYTPDKPPMHHMCRECGRAVSRTRRACFYCGAVDLDVDAEGTRGLL